MATIEQLEREIAELKIQVRAQQQECQQLNEQSRRALDQSEHAYRVDHYGYIWIWDVDLQQYKRSQMRILTPELAAEAVKARNIADNAVTTEKIQTGTIEARNIADKAVTAVKIADKTIEGTNFQDGAITEQKLKDNTIGSDKIAPSSITGDKLKDNTIGADKIMDNSITGEQIAFHTIDGNAIVPMSITGENIHPGSVDISKIAPGTLDGAAVAANCNLIGVTIDADGQILAYYGSDESKQRLRLDDDGQLWIDFLGEETEPN